MSEVKNTVEGVVEITSRNIEASIAFHDPSHIPTTEVELYTFYRNTVKRLYSVIQAENSLPAEVLFEIHAAFEHVSRIHVLGADPTNETKKAYSHLKRSCLDIYKIYLRDTLDMYDELRLTDTSIIDNGNFDHQLKFLVGEIRQKAALARTSEGDKAGENEGKLLAFELWQEVALLCKKLREDFYYDKNVAWAKKVKSEADVQKQREARNANWKWAIVGFILGIVGNILVAFLIKSG